nr:hypothetical protein [Armatimonas sp.]
MWQKFLAADLPEGLHTNIDTLRRLCRDNTEVLDLLDGVMQGKQGERTDLVHNIHDVKEDRPSGTSPEAALRRLRKDRPDLHRQVIGEIL